jgi:hypothetical protein
MPTLLPLPASPHATLACLEMARQLAAPQAVIHIGAGQGHGVLHCWQRWPVAHARIIDADESRLQWLPAQATSTAAPDWQALVAVVADRDGDVDFHPASNPAEDGLLPVSALLGLWPNLRALPHNTQPAQRLDTLLTRHPLPAPSADAATWLIIDCLPALRILHGAADTLNRVSVVCLRAVLDPARLADPHASLAAAADFLAGQGFRCVHVGETNHPAVAEALFLRDDKTALQAALDAQAKLATERAAQIDDLTKAKATADKLAADRAAQLDALTQAKATAEQLAAERQTQLDALAQARDAQTQLATERAAQIDDLTKAKAAADKLAADRAAQIDALTQARDAQTKLATERAAQIDDLTKAKAAADKLAADRAAQIDALKQDNAALTTERDALKQTISEGQHRQQLLEEEMIKADAQLELIKDLLLREPGL